MPIFGNLFLSVGAMKAGTTWLYAVLAHHPELHFSPEKEIHYFHHKYMESGFLSDAHRLKNAKGRFLTNFDPQKANVDRVRQNLHWVAAYLSRPVDDFWFKNLFHMRPHEQYACEFSNLNAHLPQTAWPQIEAQCDRLRVLYTMRNPVKRLWSHTKFHLELNGQLDKLESWTPSQFEDFVREPHIWNNAEYGQVLRRLRQGLPSETWKAVFFEDIHADQRAMLREIETFLGITPYDYPQWVLERHVNVSRTYEMPAFFPGLFADDIQRINQEIVEQGFKLPAAWSQTA